jgi:hypothetical protein
MKTWSDEEPVNIGTGTDVTIAELAKLIAAPHAPQLAIPCSSALPSLTAPPD